MRHLHVFYVFSHAEVLINRRVLLYAYIDIIQEIRINKETLKELLNDVVRKSKLEKRKRKTTEQELMEHDLPEVVLQILD